MSSEQAEPQAEQSPRVAAAGAEGARLCEHCGATGAAKRCSKCLSVRYCGVDCMKEDWRAGRHRERCGMAANAGPGDVDEEMVEMTLALAAKLGRRTVLARGILAFLQCQRCCGPMVGKCEVQHPPRAGENTSTGWWCRACDSSYTLSTPQSPSKKCQRKWCFRGFHTLRALPAADKRRDDGVGGQVILDPRTGGLQAQIDALPDTVVDLAIVGSEHAGTPPSGAVLARRLPCLEKLKIGGGVGLAKLLLNSKLTPALRTLEFDFVDRRTEMDVRVKTLRNVVAEYSSLCPASLNRMFKHATKLESFSSYKLSWSSNAAMVFASTALKSVKLHRCDLRTLTMYAPSLEQLNVEACWSLDKITFLPTHKLSADLPPDHDPPILRVNAQSAILGYNAEQALRNHPFVDQSWGTGLEQYL